MGRSGAGGGGGGSVAVALVAAAEAAAASAAAEAAGAVDKADLAVDSEGRHPDRRAITEAADSGKAWLSAACSTTAEAAGEADIDRRATNNQNNNGCGIGCLIVILLVFALGIFSAALGGSSDSVTKSTVQREHCRPALSQKLRIIPMKRAGSATKMS